MVHIIIKNKAPELKREHRMPVVPRLNHGRSAEKLERDYAAVIETKAKAARERARSSSKRKEGEWRHVASVPTHAYHAYLRYSREAGENGWRENKPAEIAKKLGFHFGV